MDKSSGRNPTTNAGSDSGHHYRGPASHQYRETPDTPKSEVVTNRRANGAVGNGTPGKSDERSKVRS